MRVDTPELTVHPAEGQGTVDGVGLGDGPLRCALLGEAEPGARRDLSVLLQPLLEGGRVREGHERQGVSSHARAGHRAEEACR